MKRKQEEENKLPEIFRLCVEGPWGKDPSCSPDLSRYLLIHLATYSGIISKGQINGCDLCNIGQDLFNSLQRSSPPSPLSVLPLALGDEKIGHRQAVGGINHFFRQLLGKIFSVPFNHKAF